MITIKIIKFIKKVEFSNLKSSLFDIENEAKIEDKECNALKLQNRTVIWRDVEEQRPLQDRTTLKNKGMPSRIHRAVYGLT